MSISEIWDENDRLRRQRFWLAVALVFSVLALGIPCLWLHFLETKLAALESEQSMLEIVCAHGNVPPED